MTRAMAVALVLTLVGCSLVAVRGPGSARPPAEYPRCKEYSAAIVGDIAMALTSGLVAGLLADDDDGSGDAVAYGLIAALYLGSAVHGLTATKTCRDRRSTWQKMEPFAGFAIEADAGLSPSEPDGAPSAPDGGAPSAPDGGAPDASP